MAIDTGFNLLTADISSKLNEVGLAPYADRLVVVGGAAMAAYGIDSRDDHPFFDVDVVTERSVLDELRADERWEPKSEYSDDGLTAGLVDAMSMPVDSSYKVDGEKLIGERVTPAGIVYGFSPLARILDWKLALVISPTYKGDGSKHLRHAKLIAEHLL